VSQLDHVSSSSGIRLTATSLHVLARTENAHTQNHANLLTFHHSFCDGK
jgi:hypothetical protein